MRAAWFLKPAVFCQPEIALVKENGPVSFHDNSERAALWQTKYMIITRQGDSGERDQSA